MQMEAKLADAAGEESLLKSQGYVIVMMMMLMTMMTMIMMIVIMMTMNTMMVHLV